MNFALDRKALQAVGGGPASPVGSPTSTYRRWCPASGTPTSIRSSARDLARARALARGNLRGAKAVFYATDAAFPMAIAQLAKQQLAEISLEIEVRPIPVHIASAAYLDALALT